jgi:hypothetical protein
MWAVAAGQIFGSAEVNIMEIARRAFAPEANCASLPPDFADHYRFFACIGS